MNKCGFAAIDFRKTHKSNHCSIMPIASCQVSKKCFERRSDTIDPIRLWADISGKSAEHMTISISCTDVGFGKTYDVLAQLLLPDVWSQDDIASLQVSLAKALASYFSISVNSVFVATTIVNSGNVVEDGEIQHW